MKISHKNMVIRRVRKLRHSVQIHTQKIRVELLNDLKEIFELAKTLVRGELQTQTVDGVQVKVTLKC